MDEGHVGESAEVRVRIGEVLLWYGKTDEGVHGKSRVNSEVGHGKAPTHLRRRKHLYVKYFTLSAYFDICNVKPIFHQNAKYLASGTFASDNAKSSTFALADARNTNMLVSFALGDANFLRWPCTFLFFCVYFICVG